MCKICNIHAGQFNTEKKYLDFNKKLRWLLAQGFIEKCKFNDKSLPFFISEYKCIQCNKYWILTIPDQSFRGDWHAK